MSLYSPELLSTQKEMLVALQSGRTETYKAARRRLRLWGMSRGQIEATVRRNKPRETVEFFAPTDGYVLEKHVFEGSHISAGGLLYRIAALDRVWIEAEVYENDLPHIAIGQRALVTLDHAQGQHYESAITFLYPYLEGRTRTGRLRLELANETMDLRPDMYATVKIQIPLGERLQIPIEAVIYTGPRRLVFVDLGQGRLRPQLIEVGERNQTHVEVVSGLKPGDKVVSSGNFLIAAESRIRSAADYWGADNVTQ